MANIAFVTWDGGGNVPPAVGIAQALAARGHRCHFFGYRGQRSRIEAQGFTFSAHARTGDFDKLAAPPDERRAALLRQVWASPSHLDDLPDALAAHPADLLVVDFLMHGALAWSERAHVPVVALAHSCIAGLVPPPESPMGAMILGASNALRASAGLTPLGRLNDAWSQLLTLVTTVAELDPAAERRTPSIRYVGPVVERFAEQQWTSPWAADDPRPLVLVSFSTTGLWDQSSRIRSTLAALATEPVRVLVSAREAAELGEVPANAVVREFVPHALVLPGAALTVTHCGHGTVTASLAHGVPIVGMPNQAADQPFLSRHVQALGAGLALDSEATVEAIRAAVRKVLATPSYAAAARALGDVIRASPGAIGAAREVEFALEAIRSRINRS